MRFEPYSAYEPSGLEWLGDLPTDWSAQPLKFVATLNDEVLPEATDPCREIAYVDISSVDSVAGIIATTDTMFEDAPSRARRLVRDGDSIVSTVRTYLRAIAPIRDPDPRLVVSTGFAVIRPRSILASFLSWVLREAGVVSEIVARSVGVSYPAVNASDIGDLPIPMPSTTEQLAIADFLDRETAKIDTLVAKKRTLIERLKEKRVALISRTATCGLGADAACSGGLESVPNDWTVRPLKRLARIRQGVTKGRDLGGRETVARPYLRVVNVQDGYLDLDDVATIDVMPSEVSRYRLQSGDVLMNEGGDNDKLGRGAVWLGQIEPCLHQNHVFAVRPRDPGTGEWIALWTQSDAAKTYFLLQAKQTTNLASISSSNLKELPVALPPRSERERILSFLSEVTARLDALTGRVQTAIERLLEYRTALITAAVTGKIDVRESAA